ncbi:MAG: hypothetical protein LBC30_04245 [Puniceicoccales bacterium]|jgi:hypothetical protein|nr:hypothetical protein [Puniceicoccales bacterium]
MELILQQIMGGALKKKRHFQAITNHRIQRICMVPEAVQILDWEESGHQTPLPKNAAGKTRTFMFSTDSCLFLHGSVEPYGLFGVQTQFQVHRGG